MIRKNLYLVFKGEELGQFERVGWFSDEREALRLIMTREKILKGCEWSRLGLPQFCVNEIYYAHLLQFSHNAGVEKYTSANGKIVHPSDLPSRGVSIATLLSELDKCSVLCANCHTYYTHEIERKIN